MKPHYAKSLQAENEAIKAGIRQLRRHLHTDKFLGTDNGERKDWISTSELLQWLGRIESQGMVAYETGKWEE